MIKLKTAALGRVGVAAVGLLMLPLLAAPPASAGVGAATATPGAAAGTPCLTADHDTAVKRSRDHSRVTAKGAARVHRELAPARHELRQRTATRKKLWVTIPVHAHVIYGKKPGEREMKAADVRASIRKLNQDYRGGENGGRLSTGFIFKLKSISFTTSQVQYDAAPMSQMDRYSKRIHHRGYRWALNIYFAGMTNEYGLLGWARFPWERAKKPWMDSVTVHPDTRPGKFDRDADYKAFNQGNTLTHEVGHWLGLYHTFQGGCRDLDYVADTPAQAGPISLCNRQYDTCRNKPGKDRVRNYMGYAVDRCMNHFTRGQITRMETAWLKYRARNRR